MLFSYILQFIADKKKAEAFLVEIFSGLHSRLQEACDSSLSVYCWLQVESRKMILEKAGGSRNGVMAAADAQPAGSRGNKGDLYHLLDDASPEHRRVFKELYIYGRRQEELALQMNKDADYIGGLLRESLLIIRKKLG